MNNKNRMQELNETLNPDAKILLDKDEDIDEREGMSIDVKKDMKPHVKKQRKLRGEGQKNIEPDDKTFDKFITLLKKNGINPHTLKSYGYNEKKYIMHFTLSDESGKEFKMNMNTGRTVD